MNSFNAGPRDLHLSPAEAEERKRWLRESLSREAALQQVCNEQMAGAYVPDNSDREDDHGS